MFDVGISELAIIGVVALVVLGPERLPKVARTAGHLFGRLQRYVNNVKADINREMEASELANLKKEVQDAAKSFEQTVNQTASAVETEARALEQAANPVAGETVKVEAASASAVIGVESAPVSTAAIAPKSAPIGEFQASPARTRAGGEANDQTADHGGGIAQGAFDFGIEPSRKVKRA
jgi:sec-independent protein translocase protein TatB